MEQFFVENKRLKQGLGDHQHNSIVKETENLQLRRDYGAASALLERIPPEVLQAYAERPETRKKSRDIDREVIAYGK